MRPSFPVHGLMPPSFATNPASSSSERCSTRCPLRSIPIVSATSAADFEPYASAFRIDFRNWAFLPNIWLNIWLKSRKRMPSREKQSRRMFSSDDKAGSISSRYFGTPPVIERMSSISHVETRPVNFPQNDLQSESGSSSTTKSSESRPANPVPLRMFSAIQLETLPHKMNTRLGRFLKDLSQAVLSVPAKPTSYPPIHEISSRRTTTRPPCGSALARSWNA